MWYNINILLIYKWGVKNGIYKYKRITKEKGKTKYWLIKNMEGSYQSISHMMNNETTGIKFETIEKLCKLLECTQMIYLS